MLTQIPENVELNGGQGELLPVEGALVAVLADKQPRDMFGSGFSGFDWSSFVFQLVFCATCATIVSGAMAERTKFSAYCLYSAVISLVIYPAASSAAA